MLGHYWTLRPFLAARLRAPEPPPSRAFGVVVPDERHGSIVLRGLHACPPGARGCVVIVHGLGGDSSSNYAVEAARSAHAMGLASLRLELRGADGSGHDVYHAAISGDVRAALASPELAAFERLYLLGYSLGGHVALRTTTEGSLLDARVRAAAAVCPPIDLELGARAFDGPSSYPYRRHVLASLVPLAHALERRGRLPCTLADAARVTRIRDWDRLVVAPRFGHASVEAYYAEASVAPRLSELARPSLVVAAERDPMVPSRVVRAGLAQSKSALLEVRWIDRGGHVGFPAGLDLGEAAPAGLAPQVLAWLQRAGG